ncbi:mdm2-binding protein [Lacerta agilis]|uniref:mdm2-binding protein n=1 Tax=Lacerta agilis TaxID=80427 RepID=UPI00141A058A|nr:mdm2-binding protein [Lacerta agilis]
MDRHLLFVSWRGRRGEAGPEGRPGLTAESIYNLLETNCSTSLNTKVEDFPACSLVGTPGVKAWYFAIQSISGFSQVSYFAVGDWEDINFDLETEESKISIQRNIEACLGDFQSFEDDSNSRESLSLIDLYEECAESIHLLADKLPAPGRTMVDVILHSSESDAPRLKDCLPAIGALKHLREWHGAKITIVASESKIWQKIADYLSADIVAPENLNNSIDSRDLWRGKIQIWERKFGSEITFPDFCIKGTASGRQLGTLALNPYFTADETGRTQNTNDCLSEVYHYYCPALKFVQIVMLSHLPSSLVSGLQFELSLARTDVEEKSLLFWNQISSLSGKVGALFLLPCRVSSMLIPLPTQLSTKKWKEYIAQKPRLINVPEVELKGETCNYYFLVQGNGRGGCKATLIYSASQINGSLTLAKTTGKSTTKTGETEACLFEEFIRSLPHFCGDQILQREKKLARAQALALIHCRKRQESARQLLVVSSNELKTLLTCTREHFLELWSTSQLNRPVAPVKAKVQGAACELKDSNPLKWPERNVLQNLESTEKIKPKARVSELLARKEGQKGSAISLDAKELLKYFTPEGLPIGDLQPLHVQKSENTFLLTPELTPRKLRSLPFEKAAGCHYHGLEYCLDNRRALERDVGFAELQTRLIRYETQTTCTKESCPVPCALSPLPSPAVLSEPGSVPEGESLQRELQTEASRLKRRSKDQDGFHPNKRLLKSESTDSLLSQASGSSGSRHSGVVTRQCQEISVSLPSVAVKQSHSRMHKVALKSSSASQRCGGKPETLKPTRESRSQKHTRMLKEVVAKTLKEHGIVEDHKCFAACSQRLFEISKYYLKDLKTSRGLFDEMKKAATSNVKQVIEWVLDKSKEK